MTTTGSRQRRVTGLLAGAALLAFSSAGWAQLTPFTKNFESLGAANPDALTNNGWFAFGAVFESDGTFKFPYGPFGAPNGGPGFSAIALDEGGPEQGVKQLSVYNDYNCCDLGDPPEDDQGHGNGTDLVESSVFQEQTIGAGDIGSVWTFQFDAKRGNIEGSTTALAFIKTLDPNAGFATTNFLTVDTTNLDTSWNTFSITISLADPLLDGQILQVGFSSTASNFEGSGNFYDNIILSPAAAEDRTYAYDGSATICTSTCDSFAALGGPGGSANTTPSELTGTVDINAPAGGSFGFADVDPNILFEVLNPGAALEAAIFAPDPDERCDGLDPGTLCNPTTANPLPLNSDVAELRESSLQGTSTGGVLDGNGDFVSGTLLLEFTQPPFSSNAAWAILDLGTGVTQVCLSYNVAGCIPGATESTVIDGTWEQDIPAPDTDGDGFADDVDNCITFANPGQEDTNGDGFGNACDADFNQTCSVSFDDLAAFKSFFFPAPYNADADLDSSGNVNFGDLARLKQLFFNGATPGPGPSALATCP